jgi:ribosomal protein L37E
VETKPITDKTLSRCPNCGHIANAKDQVCTSCGMPFVSRIILKKTETKLDPTTAALEDATVLHETRPLTFYCGGKMFSTPLVKTLTVGRSSNNAEHPQPDVDLTEYGAKEQGVSRRHVKFYRKRDLVYVADLGSSNCTLLNGQPLMPNAPRVLRSGDELQLGLLKVRVRF